MSPRMARLVLLSAATMWVGCGVWSGMINQMLPPTSRPIETRFVAAVGDTLGLDGVAASLAAEYPQGFAHIERFRQAGITRYEGPATCLRCHAKITYRDRVTGRERREDLMHNLTTSAHYRFYSSSHPNVYGFNGKRADGFRMGKIDRPCPKPGSFAMTAWAMAVPLASGDTLSEGCGQCHIGGQPTAPLGEMMPRYGALGREQEAVDCLICHSVAYDMNQKQVVRGDDGRYAWGQDRSLRAAVAVTRPVSQACLRCHQHNMGGDLYVDPADPSFMESLTHPGADRPRVKHPGSKRGTPFSPSWDVHAAAGVACIDCHLTQGHYIAKGTHTTTMMANDLPAVEVACEACHTAAPHQNGDAAMVNQLNAHTDRVACQTCHIPSLHPDNATRRDFARPSFEAEPGLWVYTDIAKETEPGKAITYVWWNGDATFLGNPIGDHPDGGNRYRFYRPGDVWPEYRNYDYAGWYERTMRPLARQGRSSKIYAMKVFNGRQHIDLQNMGPFGGMFVPYNLGTYYTTGNPDSAAKVEMRHPMMRKMYGRMFQMYMMNRFMGYMDIDGWNRGAYRDAVALRHVEPRWLPQDASLEISHAIRRTGALTCNRCHSEHGVMDFTALGYDDQKAAALRQER